MHFTAYMDNLVKQYGLKQEIDGAKCHLNVVLEHGTHAEITYDLLNPTNRAYVRGGVFVPPITKNGRAKFMDFLLEFNRNALSVMNVGLMPHPKTDCIFTSTWYVPRADYTQKGWDESLANYEGLVMHAQHHLKEIITEWTHYVH